MHTASELSARQLLEWYLEAGVDEACAPEASNYFTAPPYTAEPDAMLAPQLVPPAVQSPASAVQRAKAPAAPLQTPSAAMAAARALADAAQDLATLEAAVQQFEGCAIKKTAHRTVFADGNPSSGLMIIGEAPGEQEDIEGIPFCGSSGQLLDRMLAAIGLDRRTVYISNTVFWRPPGNRPPNGDEINACLPLVEKHIALVNPKLLVLAGGTATKALLKSDAAVTRMRGRFYDYANPYMTQPVQTLVTFHPSYLLRSPAQKRFAWADLLLLQQAHSQLR